MKKKREHVTLNQILCTIVPYMYEYTGTTSVSLLNIKPNISWITINIENERKKKKTKQYRVKRVFCITKCYATRVNTFRQNSFSFFLNVFFHCDLVQWTDCVIFGSFTLYILWQFSNKYLWCLRSICFSLHSVSFVESQFLTNYYRHRSDCFVFMPYIFNQIHTQTKKKRNWSYSFWIVKNRASYSYYRCSKNETRRRMRFMCDWY